MESPALSSNSYLTHVRRIAPLAFAPFLGIAIWHGSQAVSEYQAADRAELVAERLENAGVQAELVQQEWEYARQQEAEAADSVKTALGTLGAGSVSALILSGAGWLGSRRRIRRWGE